MEWNVAWWSDLEARLNGQADLRHHSRWEAGVAPRDASAISEQSGWCATTATGPSTAAGARRRESAVAPGARPSSTRSSTPVAPAIRSAVWRARTRGLGDELRGRDASRQSLGNRFRLGHASAGGSRRRWSGSPGPEWPWRTRKTSTASRIEPSRVPGVAGYRYLVADVFTDRALAGDQLAVFTDARGLDDATMQALALEVGFLGDDVRAPPEQGGTARVRIFTPKTNPSRAHPVLGGLGAGRASAARARRARDRRRPGARGARTRRLRCDRLRGAWSSRCRASSRTRTGVTPRGSRRHRVPPAGGTVRQRRSVHVRRARLADEVAALRPTSPLLRLGAPSALLAGEGARLEDADVRARRRRSRTPRRAPPRRPARRPRVPPRLVEWGGWIEISQGVEIGRPSTLFARAGRERRRGLARSRGWACCRGRAWRVRSSSSLDEVEPECALATAWARVDAELGVDVLHVRRHGLGADRELAPDLVGPAGGEQAQHLSLACRQAEPEPSARSSVRWRRTRATISSRATGFTR